MAIGGLFVPLDVNYPDNPRIIASGEKAEVLYVRGLCLAKRTMKDGFIDAHQLSRMGLTGVDARAESLCHHGLWKKVKGGFKIVGWSGRNPSAKEITAKADAKREAGILGNHKRWHTDKIDPNCDHCTESQVR
jgi:hypothetical protein